MKKRTISILCGLFLALACVLLIGCGGSKAQDMSNSAYVGTWKCVQATFMGEEVPADDVFEDGEVILTLNADGTATLTGDGEDSSGTWSETSTGIKLGGSDFNWKLEDKDGQLVGRIIGVDLVFERQ